MLIEISISSHCGVPLTLEKVTQKKTNISDAKFVSPRHSIKGVDLARLVVYNVCYTQQESGECSC